MRPRPSISRSAAAALALVLFVGVAACSSSGPTSTSSDSGSVATEPMAADTSVASDDTADTAATDDTEDSADTADTAVVDSNVPSAPRADAPTADNLCKLLPPDQAKTVLADLPGSGEVVQERDYETACVYEKGDASVEIEQLDADTDYDGPADYTTSHTGQLIFEDVTGLPGVDAAYWNKSDSTLGVLIGTEILNVQVTLDDASSDFDPTSDKAAEKELATAVMTAVLANRS